MQWTVLASGSRGNASLVRAGGPALLIDVGLGARDLERRLSQAGEDATALAGAVLTHTHGDHVGDASLAWLARRGVPLYCHEGHRHSLARHGAFQRLEAVGLVRLYDDRPWIAPNGMQVEPIALSHDDEPTYGFRIEAREGRLGPTTALGYVADTGIWDASTVEALAGVDLLGIEANHDVEMQVRSPRPRSLVRRVLGERGHLSNDQAADLLGALAARSGRAMARVVVLLHLSQQCNRPELALDAASRALRRSGGRVTLAAASQNRPSRHEATRARRPPRRSGAVVAAATATSGGRAWPISS